METINHFADLAHNLGYDFLKLLIFLPIAIIFDLIIKAINKKNEKNNQSVKATNQATEKPQTKKRMTKKEKEELEKGKRKTRTLILIVVGLYAIPVVGLSFAALTALITGSNGPAAFMGIMSSIAVLVLLIKLNSKK